MTQTIWIASCVVCGHAADQHDPDIHCGATAVPEPYCMECATTPEEMYLPEPAIAWHAYAVGPNTAANTVTFSVEVLAK